MKILRVAMKNFRAHADSVIPIPEEGITGIVGDNESGKSSILEAVMWAFFGGRYARGTSDSIRWRGAPPRNVAKAIVDLRVDGKVYRVERSETAALIHNLTDNRPEASGVTETSNAVERLLGMGPDEFLTTHACLQKDVARLASLGPTERTAFVRKVTGREGIDTALEQARADRSKTKNRAEALSEEVRHVPDFEERVEVAEEEAAERKEKIEAHQAWLAEQEEVVSRVRESVEAHRGRYRKHAELEAAVASARKGVDAAESRVSEAERKVESLSGARDDLESAQKALDDFGEWDGEAYVKLREDLTRAQGREAERDRVESQIRRLEERVKAKEGEISLNDALMSDLEKEAEDILPHQLETMHAELVDKRDAASAQLHQLEKEIHELRSRQERKGATLRRLQDMGPECPTCTQELDEETLARIVGGLEEELADLSEQIEAKQASHDDIHEAREEDGERLSSVRSQQERWERIRAANRKQTELNAELSEIQAELDEARGSLPEQPEDLDALHAKVAAAKDRRWAYDRLRTELERQEASVGKLQRAHDELDEARKALDGAKHDLRGAQEALGSSEYDEGLLRAAEGALKDEEETLSGIREQIAGERSSLKAAERSLEALRNEKRRAEESVERAKEAQEEAVMADKVAMALEDFRVAAVSSIRPEMEELTSGLVSILTDGRHEAVTLSETYEPTVYEQGEPSEVVSGGAEDIVALAMRLALSQMVAERSGRPVELLWLDEPFGSQDESRRGNVLRMIRGLRDVFGQVVTISHVAETKDAVDWVVELDHDEAERRTRVVRAPEVA